MRSNLFKLLVALLALAFVAAACGDDDDESGPVSTGEPQEATEEPGDIVEVAVESGQFPTLVAAVTEAGLVETLQGEGPFTVFAPTEEAFASALDALGITAEELLADTETLTAILTYHVVPGKNMAADVVELDGQSIATVNGAEVSIAVEGESVMVNGAKVVTADIEASNGVIHAIDAVLLPPA